MVPSSDRLRAARGELETALADLKITMHKIWYTMVSCVAKLNRFIVMGRRPCLALHTLDAELRAPAPRRPR